MGVYLNCECSVGSDGTIDFCDVHGAAPEMLGVLQEWIRLVDGGPMGIESASVHLDRLHTLARAAITKATGGKP